MTLLDFFSLVTLLSLLAATHGLVRLLWRLQAP